MEANFKETIMQRQNILDKLINCLKKNLNIPFPAEVIHPDVFLFGSGLGLDSIDALEVVMTVENEFGISLDGSNLQAMRTINTLADSILAQQSNNSMH